MCSGLTRCRGEHLECSPCGRLARCRRCHLLAGPGGAAVALVRSKRVDYTFLRYCDGWQRCRCLTGGGHQNLAALQQFTVSLQGTWVRFGGNYGQVQFDFDLINQHAVEQVAQLNQGFSVVIFRT